jgi:nucleotide-binding universal stress UspA family protein
MKAETILLPLDIRACPLEVFSLVARFARRPCVSIILLHVIQLNIPFPDNRVRRELQIEARWYLERLAGQSGCPAMATIPRVRFGQPAAQILEEAEAENVDLIVLPTYQPSFWRRLVALWKPSAGVRVSPLAQRIIREANCGVFLAGVTTRFNCEAEWRRPASRSHRALDCSGMQTVKPW